MSTCVLALAVILVNVVDIFFILLFLAAGTSVARMVHNIQLAFGHFDFGYVLCLVCIFFN